MFSSAHSTTNERMNEWEKLAKTVWNKNAKEKKTKRMKRNLNETFLAAVGIIFSV